MADAYRPPARDQPCLLLSPLFFPALKVAPGPTPRAGSRGDPRNRVAGARATRSLRRLARSPLAISRLSRRATSKRSSLSWPSRSHGRRKSRLAFASKLLAPTIRVGWPSGVPKSKTPTLRSPQVKPWRRLTVQCDGNSAVAHPSAVTDAEGGLMTIQASRNLKSLK